MGDLDRGAKAVLQHCPQDLVEMVCPGVTGVRAEPGEVVTANLVFDRVLLGTNQEGQEVVFNLEFEAGPPRARFARLRATPAGSTAPTTSPWTRP